MSVPLHLLLLSDQTSRYQNDSRKHWSDTEDKANRISENKQYGFVCC